jgi:baseplate J-like protein
LPLQLPNLDDLRWKDLVAEGRSLIPSSAEEWTNHNPSDPGITLIELFAYISGTLMYQLNRITEADTAQFLSLINGPEWKRKKSLAGNDPLDSVEMRETLRAATNAEERQRTFRTLLLPTRAVTVEDYESLVCAIQGVGRVKCLPQRNLENEDPPSRWLDAPGHVSVVVLPLSSAHPTPELLAQIRQALEPVRLLTTRVHAVAPRYVTIGVQLSIVATRNTPARDVLRDAVAEKIRLFLDPHRGWFDGEGWPLGRDLYISELYQLIAGITGVDSVAPSKDSQGVSKDEITVPISFLDRIVRGQSGKIQAITLRPDEMFNPQIETRYIEIAKHVW